MIPTKEIEEYIKAGKKIQAVKLVRDYTGYSLKDAKDYVDNLESTIKNASATQKNNIYHRGTISAIDGMEGHEFEYFCADLLRKIGFSDVSVTPGSGDQGVDVLASKDGIKYAIQCKNYASALSNTPVQEVSAGKQFYGCHVGVVMTNSTFTPGAIQLANATNVLLWDRTKLEELVGQAGGLESFNLSDDYYFDADDTDDEMYDTEYWSEKQSSLYPKSKKMNPIAKTFLIILDIFLVAILVVLITFVAPQKRTQKVKPAPITFDQLYTTDHPKVYDTYDEVKKYYKQFTNTYVGAYQSHPNFEDYAVTAQTYLEYDYIYLLTINLNNVSADRTFTLDDAISLAIDYIPLDMILSYYDFEKAIYKNLPGGGTTYECYYYEGNSEVPEVDGKPLRMQHGFSLAITELSTGSYIIDIGDDWYDYKYNSAIGPKPSQEELDSHIPWDFNLEDYHK